MPNHDSSEDWVTYNVPMGMCEIIEEVEPGNKLYFEVEICDSGINMNVLRCKSDSGIRSDKDEVQFAIPLDPTMMRRLLDIHDAMKDDCDVF
jgi:hypothetical protein